MSTIEDISDYMNKYILVTLNDSSTIEGECFTVDPVTKSIVLISEEKETNVYSSHIILPHAVKTISVETSAAPMLDSQKYQEYKEKFIRLLNGRNENNSPNENNSLRRDKLKKWLEENRIPVTVLDGNQLSVINGIVIIEPPYTVDSCRSTNTIVLGKLMEIVKACPDVEN